MLQFLFFIQSLFEGGVYFLSHFISSEEPGAMLYLTINDENSKWLSRLSISIDTGNGEHLARRSKIVLLGKKGEGPCVLGSRSASLLQSQLSQEWSGSVEWRGRLPWSQGKVWDIWYWRLLHCFRARNKVYFVLYTSNNHPGSFLVCPRFSIKWKQ